MQSAPRRPSSSSAPAARSPAAPRRPTTTSATARRRCRSRALVARCRRRPGVVVESEQVAQLDSKDMDFATWRALAGACAGHLARADVAAIVVTHGTDTLEETAYFLQRVARAGQAGRADRRRCGRRRRASPTGRRTCADAVAVATAPGARGVVVVVAGAVHAALDGPQGPSVSPRRVRLRRRRADRARRGRPAALVRALAGGRSGRARRRSRCRATTSAWPWVAVVASGAGRRSTQRFARSSTPAVAGIVVAATGNGTRPSRARGAAARSDGARLRRLAQHALPRRHRDRCRRSVRPPSTAVGRRAHAAAGARRADRAPARARARRRA